MIIINFILYYNVIWASQGKELQIDQLTSLFANFSNLFT